MTSQFHPKPSKIILILFAHVTQNKKKEEVYRGGTVGHRRFRQWVRTGVLELILQTLAQDLKERGWLNLEECFINSTFISAKKRARIGATKRGKGSKVIAVANRAGLPLATWVASASPREAILMEPTLQARGEVPQRVIGDRAYQSDPLDERLAAQGIAMIAPHRRNRTKPQDGRPLRQCRRRSQGGAAPSPGWQTSRPLLVRYERHLAHYLGFVHVDCIIHGVFELTS